MSAKYSYRNDTPKPYYYPFTYSQNETPLTNHIVLEARLAKHQVEKNRKILDIPDSSWKLANSNRIDTIFS